MIVETLNFGLGLLVPVLLYGIAVSFLTSPVIVAGWAFGFGREIFFDPSDQARLIRTFHAVTTAIVALLVAWAAGAF